MTTKDFCRDDALDEALGGGFSRGQLNEFCLENEGSGALEAMLPSLCPKPGSDGPQLRVWITTSTRPYPPGLAALGEDLDRWLFLVPADRDGLWDSLELVLGSGLFGLVVGVLDEAPLAILRRLQVAARRGGQAAVLIRSGAQARAASAAPVRMRLASEAAGSPRRRRLLIDVFKRPGLGYAQPLCWEWGFDAMDAPPLVRLRDRSAVAPGRGRRVADTRAFGA